MVTHTYTHTSLHDATLSVNNIDDKILSYVHILLRPYVHRSTCLYAYIHTHTLVIMHSHTFTYSHTYIFIYLQTTTKYNNDIKSSHLFEVRLHDGLVELAR